MKATRTRFALAAFASLALMTLFAAVPARIPAKEKP
jgi:hypothetical protein